MGIQEGTVKWWCSGATAIHVRMVEPAHRQGLILNVTAALASGELFVMLSVFLARLPNPVFQDQCARMEELALIWVEYSLVHALQVTLVATVKRTLMIVHLVHVRVVQHASIKSAVIPVSV